jgi:hypothetical protein
MKATILIASKNRNALDILYRQSDIEVKEALTTDGVRHNLSACHLAIIDLDDLQAGKTTLEDLSRVLEQSSVAYVTAKRFLEDTAGHLTMVRQSAKKGGNKQSFAPRTIAIVSSAGSGGGVGKTTLALHSALRFRQKTGLPVMVGEFCFGASGVSALTNTEFPSIYDSVTDHNIESGTWENVTLAPIDYAMARLRPRSDYEGWYQAQKKRFTLIVLDISYPNELLPEDIIDQWIILAHAERRDTIFSALRMQEMLKGQGISADILLNFYKRGDGLVLKGVQRTGEIPVHNRASRLDGTLGKHILDVVYNNWSKTMERKSLWGRK